jgi:sec-independent protein translocase protein TatA
MHGGEMMSIGWGEVLVVLFLVLLLFGGKRLPELARSMGHAVNEFKRGLNSSVSESKNIEFDAKNNEKNENS